MRRGRRRFLARVIRRVFGYARVGRLFLVLGSFGGVF